MRRLAIAQNGDPLDDIARRLLAVRLASSLNQEKFAQRLGFPKRTYLGWERAETEPPIRLLDAVERQFGIDPKWMLHGPGEIPRKHADDIDWVRLREIGSRVDALARRLGLDLDFAALHELAEAIYVEPPELEAQHLKTLEANLKAVARMRR